MTEYVWEVTASVHDGERFMAHHYTILLNREPSYGVHTICDLGNSEKETIKIRSCTKRKREDSDFVMFLLD